MSKDIEYKTKNYPIYPKGGSGLDFEIEEKILNNGKRWRTIKGLVETPHGFVIARSYYHEHRYSMCIFEMIKDGRKYHLKLLGVAYTRNKLVNLAKKFSNDLYEPTL